MNTDQQNTEASEAAVNAELATEMANEPSELELAKAEAETQKNKYLYLYAEFETFKKRAIRERSDLLKFGHESLMRDLLQVADNLDRALAFSDVAKEASSSKSLVEGLQMVAKQLQSTLERYGVGVISALGEKFNPEFHEALAEEPVDAENKIQPGSVLREHSKGYTLHGRLLRASKVVVAKAK